jgi:hypothetical protein
MMQVMDIRQIGNAQSTQERYLDYVLLCKIIIILNMEIVASKEEIVGNPKLLGAGPKQQAAGPVSNPQ